MNLRDKFHSFLTGNSAAGVECYISPEGKNIYSLVILTKKKSVVSIEKSYTDLTSLEEIKKLITDEIPLSLIIHGKGIISRKLPVNPNENEQQLLNRVLPGAQLKDFVSEHNTDGEKEFWVNVIRKETFENVLQQFREQSLIVISCTIGVNIISSLLPFTEKDKPQIRTDIYSIKLANSSITEIIMQDSISPVEDISVAGEKIPAKLIIAYTAAITVLVPSLKRQIFSSVVSGEMRNDFLQKNLFGLLWKTALGFFFLLLFINFFVFQHYAGKSNHLINAAAVNRKELDRSEQLEQELKTKQEFLLNTGILRNQKTSLIADRLISDMPDVIRLTDLNISPRNKNKADEADEVFSFAENRILISGVCKHPEQLNQWISILKGKNWIENIKVLDYKQDNNLDAGVFTVELTINHKA